MSKCSSHIQSMKKCYKSISHRDTTFKEKICYAVFPDGKKERHQNRIPVNVLKEFETELIKKEKNISAARNFKELHDIIEEIGRKHKGIGPLTIYDTAQRYGEQNDVYPEEVYLHAGTKVGALNAGLIKKYSREKTLTMSEVLQKHNWLNGLTAHNVEDFLCVCKESPTKESLKRYLEERCK